jgi:hypothetical protein
MKRSGVLSISLCLLAAVLLAGGVDARSSPWQPGPGESGVAPADPSPTPTPGRTVRVSGFQLSATRDGPATTRFLSGTSSVFVSFGYETALNDHVAVQLRDEFGNLLFEQEAVYTGGGTVSLEVTGQTAYLSYWQATEPSMADLLQAIALTRAAPSVPELLVRLQGALAQAYQYRGLLLQLQRYPLPTPAADALDLTLAAVDRAIARAQEALSPGLTEAQIRNLVDQMGAEAGVAMDQATTARALAGDGQGFVFPDNQTDAANIANLFVNGFVAQTIEWRMGQPQPSPTPTASPTVGTATPSPTPSRTPTPTATPSPTATPTPVLIQIELLPRPGAAGYVVSRDRMTNYLGEPHMYTGLDDRLPIATIFHGVVQFDLSSLPADAQLVAAQVELTGLDDRYLNGYGGTWRLNLLSSSVDEGWFGLGYWQLHNAPVEQVLVPVLTDQDLAPGRVNVFSFEPAQLATLQMRLAGSGRASFRLDGDAYSPRVRHIFDWDPGYGHTGAQPPVLRLTYRQPTAPGRAGQ